METKKDRLHYTPAGAVKESAASRGEFMCICNEEGKRKCEECMARVCEVLGATPEDIVTKVTMAITWGFKGWSGSITGVPCDMWFAVTAELVPHDDGFIPGADRERETIPFFVQCDRVEHGFARLYELMCEAVEEALDGGS